jgi:hypothetical protein
MKISVILEMLTAQFETDSKRAQKVFDQSVREIEGAAKRAGVAVGAGLAGAATALGALAQQAIKTADQMGEASQRTGVTTEALSRLKFAAEQSGTSFAAVEKGLQRIAREADAGGATLQRIGVAATDSAGKMRPVNDILLDVADRFGRMGNATERAAAAQAIFGKAGAELVPLLSQGRAGIEALGDEAERLGIVFSQETADAAGAFNDNLDKLKSAALGLGNDLATELLPALLEVTNAAVAFVQQIREDGTLAAWIDGIREAAGYIDELAVFIATRLVAGALVGLISSLGATGASLLSVTALTRGWSLALATLGGPIGVALTAAAALGVAIYSYEDAADQARDASETLARSIDVLNEAQGQGIRPALAAAEAQREAASAALEQAKADLAAAQARAKLNEQMQASLMSGPRGEPGAGAAIGGAGIAVALSAAEVQELQTVIAGLEATIGDSNAAIDKSKQKLREWEERLRGIREEGVRLAPKVKDVTDETQKLREAMEAAEDARFDDYMERVRDAAEGAQGALDDMQRDLVGELGGPGQQAVDEWAAAILRAKAALDLLRQSAPLTAEQIAQFSDIAIKATEKLNLKLDEVNESQEEAARRADTVANRVADSWQSGIDQMSYAIADFLTGQIDSWNDFGDALVNIWKRTIADMLGAAIRANLTEALQGGGIQSLFGGSGTASLLGGSGGGSALTSLFQAGSGGPVALAMAINYAVYGALGRAFGGSEQGAAIGGTLLGPIGALIGGIIGPTEDPLLRVRSTEFSGNRRSEGRATSALGDIFVRTEDLGDGAPTSPEIAQRIADFDNLLAGFLNEEQLAAVRERLANVNDTFRDGTATIESALSSRFGAVLSVMSENVQRFVGSAGTLEDRVRRLADAIQIEGIVDAGTIGNSFDVVAALLEEYRSGTEDLGQTYGRIMQSVGLLESALDLSGVSLNMTREQFVRFATDITEAAGGVERASALWTAYFENFYSAQERAELAVRQATQSAEQQFADIGLNLGDFTGEGGSAAFRQAFESILPELSAEQVVEWLEAAAALGLLNEAIAALGGNTETGATAIGTVDDLLGSFMERIEEQIGRLAPPPSFEDRIAAVNAEIAQLIADAEKLGASEEQIARIRELGQLRLGAILEEQSAAMAAQAQAASDLSGYLANLAAEAGGGITPLTGALQSLRSEYDEHIRRITELAIASGRTAASQEELAIATDWYRGRVRLLIAELTGEAQSIVAQLYGGTATGAATGTSINAAGGETGAIAQVQTAMQSRYEEELRYLQQLQDFINGLSLSSLSPLTPEERLAEAQRQYLDLLARAQSGDVDALGQLQQAAQAYLQEAQGFFGGVGAYSGIFSSVQQALQALVLNGPMQPQTGGTQVGGGGGGAVTVEPGPGFVELSVAERLELASQLVTVLRDLIAASGSSLSEVSSQLGLDLRDLVTDLGVNLDELTTASAVRLSEIARALGVELGDLASSIGIDLGSLADEQSLLNDALESTIDGLPPEFREQLREYLTAIEDATSEADARAAVAAAEAEIERLPPNIRDMLAPFFGGISSPTDSLLAATLDQAGDVAQIVSIAGEIRDILNEPEPVPPEPPIPGIESAVVIELAAVREELATLRRERKAADRESSEQMDRQTQTIQRSAGGATLSRGR